MNEFLFAGDVVFSLDRIFLYTLLVSLVFRSKSLYSDIRSKTTQIMYYQCMNHRGIKYSRVDNAQAILSSISSGKTHESCMSRRKSVVPCEVFCH